MAVAEAIDFEAFNRQIEDMLKEEAERRRQPPEVELFDGDWNSVGVCGQAISAKATWIDNETGTAVLEMPLNYYLSEWAINVDGRATSDVHIRIEKDGARWTGKMDELKIIKDDTGRRYVRLLFKHDLEQLKKMIVYPNPFLPPEIQFPRLWLCFGKAKWALKTTLLCTIMRLESSLWTLPDNPLDKTQWNNFNQSTWWNVVKPTMPGEIDNSLPAIVHSRMKTMFDTGKKIAADSQMSWECRRYLPGDPPPWEGANLRYGCLVWDLVDKSGFNTGTAFRGNLFAGFIKEFLNIHGDGITETVEQVDDPNVPGIYPTPEVRGTTPSNPGVVFWESEMSGIQSSEYSQRPAGAVGSVAGGHSMPGVNELISATVQMIGDLTAMIPFVPPLGGIADALLKPLYCVAGDTVVDGPDGKERIDYLAERGGSFRVWSITPDGERVPATASFAFKKGRTELFEYKLANGRTLTATAHHRWLTRDGWQEAKRTPLGVDVATMGAASDVDLDAPAGNLPDDAWSSVDGPAIEWSAVVSVEPVGWQDFYDMTVPGWVNYAGNGIWNHNTDVFLAFGKIKSSSRARRSGGAHYHEEFAEGADKAYTLGYLLAQRAQMWKTREVRTCTLKVADNAPWTVGDYGGGDFFLGDRVGFNIIGMPTGVVYVEQVSELTLSWDRDNAPAWDITIGQRQGTDPVLDLYESIQEIFSITKELGVM